MLKNFKPGRLIAISCTLAVPSYGICKPRCGNAKSSISQQSGKVTEW